MSNPESSVEELETDEQNTVAPEEEIEPIVVSDEIGQLLAYRGDLALFSRPLGVIDSKLFLFDHNDLGSFEARSGPAQRLHAEPFDWSTSFPNSSHIGQPEVFSFEPVKPEWIWI